MSRGSRAVVSFHSVLFSDMSIIFEDQWQRSRDDRPFRCRSSWSSLHSDHGKDKCGLEVSISRQFAHQREGKFFFRGDPIIHVDVDGICVCGSGATGDRFLKSGLAPTTDVGLVSPSFWSPLCAARRGGRLLCSSLGLLVVSVFSNT